MKYPINEHGLESAYNEYLRRAGCWAHHFDFEGFPDTTYASPVFGTGFIEYKFIRDRDVNRPMLGLFTDMQPARFAEMISSGARITLIAFHVWAVYAETLTVEKIIGFREETALSWMDRVDSCEWDNLRGMIRELNCEP